MLGITYKAHLKVKVVQDRGNVVHDEQPDDKVVTMHSPSFSVRISN